MARRWSTGLGVWLGILAIAVNALLPIHLARDIIHAAGHLRMAALAAEASVPAPDHHHHHDHPGGQHHHHDGGCLICSGLSAAAAATTLPTPIVVATPAVLTLASPPPAASLAGESAAHTPYAPRAPPGAI